MRIILRTATTSDHDDISALIRASARTLGVEHYSLGQIEGALQTAFGLDTQLIADRTYFVAECEGSLVGCGGWSFRETLFGSDHVPGRSNARIDPATGAAKIRAFFVHPAFARRGIGSLILERCEGEAQRHGFTRLELMATLGGKRLYEKHGYVAGDPVDYPLDGGLSIEFVPMTKQLDSGSHFATPGSMLRNTTERGRRARMNNKYDDPRSGAPEEEGESRRDRPEDDAPGGERDEEARPGSPWQDQPPPRTSGEEESAGEPEEPAAEQGEGQPFRPDQPAAGAAAEEASAEEAPEEEASEPKKKGFFARLFGR